MFKQIPAIPAKFREIFGDNVRFAPVLGKMSLFKFGNIWQNLKRSPNFFKICENLQEF